MNVLIEQRPTIITSSKSQQQQSQISNENDMNNSSSSSSPLVLKIKRHSTKQQQQHRDLNSNSSHMSEEDNNSRSTNNTPRLKRTSISNTIATRRPSSPAFNGKQPNKRSVTIDSNNNDLTSNIDDISSTKRFKRDHLNVS